ncbi:MAG: glycosyl hydrolase [Akkermansiaceae bacterium]|nr:glycosyl hydrolase [Akkermansiaceae bacterium]
MPRPVSSSTATSRILLTLFLSAFTPTMAATIQSADVTTTLGPSFFVDDASNGGSDTDINQPAVVSFTRLFNGLLTPNQGPTRIVISGLGFAAHTSATANDATTVTATFTYLGADQAIGGGDDVLIGSSSGNFVFSGGGEYSFAFDAPLTADLDITGTRFRIQLAPTNSTGNGSLKLKSGTLASEPSLSGAKLSVAGSAASSIIPGRVNLAKFQPVTVSSATSQRIGDYVTDGHTGNDNRWQSSNTNWNTARIDFPFPVEIGSAQVFTGIDDTNAIPSFSLQYLDGSTWVDIPGATVTSNTQVERNLIFSSPVTATAFRIIGQQAPLRVREIALYPPNGPAGFPIGTDLTVNLAYQRPTLASSHVTGSFPLRAVDGRTHSASFWQTTTPGTNTLDIDLRVTTRVGSIHLYSGSSGVAPLSAFTLKYWDGSTWVNIPGGSVSANNTADLVLGFTPVATSQIRLEFNNPATTSIRELMVFPANPGNTGYPLGTNVIASGAIADYDIYHDAFHRLIHDASGLALTVAANNQPSLDPSGLAPALSQYQVLLNLSNGTYRLRNRSTGMCLAGSRLSTTPGLPLVDEPYSALPHQDWILSPLGGGRFQILNAWSGLAIDSQNSTTAPATPLVQNSSDASPTQIWRIQYSEKYPKKGIGGSQFTYPTSAKWAYTWGLINSRLQPPDSSFYPMHWGNFAWEIGSTQGPHWQHYANWRRRADGIHYLGFNEPDRFDQAGRSMDPTNPATEAAFDPDRTIATAVSHWPRLQSMDQPLVSPVPASPTSNWFVDFYSEVDRLGYRVDYTSIHLYPGPSGGSADNLIASIQNANTSFGRPVWLTEFSFVDWGKNQSWSEEDNYQTLAEFLWRAESLPALRKYALFVFTENSEWPQPPNAWQDVTPAPRSNTYDANGNLTAFGKLYAAWDNDTTVWTDKTYYIHHRNSRKRIANLTTQTNLSARNIRIDATLVRWKLLSAGAPNRFHIVSDLDGRRLGTDGTTVSLSPAGTTGTNVEWSLTEREHGWFYIGHPASGRRLQLVYNNSNFVSTYTMATGTTTTDAVQWRFIVPPPSPTWTGTEGNSWTNSRTWIPDMPLSSSDLVTFNQSSVDNLITFLDQNFSINGLVIRNPAGTVTIAGSQTLTLGSSGMDLSAATRDLSVTAPLQLSAAQSWNIASGRNVSVWGGLGGAFALNLTGNGSLTLASSLAANTPLTVSSGSTLRTSSPGALPSGASALIPTITGTLDLAGTSQILNFIQGTGNITNTSSNPATLTLGTADTGGTLSVTLQDSPAPITLVKSGTANLILPQANNHRGGFTNQGSGHILPHNESSFGTGPVTMNAGTLYSTAANLNFTNPLTLNNATLRVGGSNNRTLQWSGPLTVTGNSGIAADGGTSGITLSGEIDITQSTFTATGSSNLNTLSGNISGNGGSLIAAGNNSTLVISGNASHTGTTTIQNNCFLRLAASGSLPASGNIQVDGTLTIRNTQSWVHSGNISGDNSNSINLNSGTNATLTGPISGVQNIFINDPGTDAGILGPISGITNITLQTAVDANGNGATLRLGGANSYSGNTTIQRGRLLLAASHVLPDSSPVSIGNATLDAATFQDSTGTLDPTAAATLHLGPGATLAFSNSSAVNWSGGSLTITGSFVSGSSLRFGTDASGLTPAQLAAINIPGTPGPYSLNAAGFLVTPVTAPFELWKTANSTAGAFHDDHDADGVANGIEFFLGGTSNTTGFTPLPTATREGGNIVVIWTMGTGYDGTYGDDFIVETSSLLASDWSPVALGTGADRVEITGREVRYVFPPGGKSFVRLKVTGP